MPGIKKLTFDADPVGVPPRACTISGDPIKVAA
jgi:hypothetical protein